MTVESFAARLRAATWSDHSAAEQTSFLAELAGGRLSLAAHIDLTAQHYLIYAKLESAAAAWQADPSFGVFHTPQLTRLPELEADLRYLIGPDWREALVPTSGTVEYLARLDEIGFTWAGGYVAHHYNRYLGDLSGGQYIARGITRHYGLQLDGIRFYRFDRIPDLAAFKESYRAKLDHAGWDLVEQDRIIDEVKTAYRLNTGFLADLTRRHIPFTPEVVAQIMRHMNGDHLDDSLVICRALGNRPHATRASMSGMDADGIDFEVIVDGKPEQVRVPFAQRLTERAQVRVEVTRLYHEAAALLTSVRP